MEDLRRTAMAYYLTAPEEIRGLFETLYNEMVPNYNGHVTFEVFSECMETNGFQHMASYQFFEELKQPANEGLDMSDVITLFYIIQSGRPFCGGSCKQFVKGMYFTCVKCFFGNENTTFSVCSWCFSAEKYKHCHNCFMDPVVLLKYYKTMEALNKQEKQSSTYAAQKQTTSSSVSLTCSDETKKGKKSSTNAAEKREVSSSTGGIFKDETKKEKKSSTNAAQKQEGKNSSTIAARKQETSSSTITIFEDGTKKSNKQDAQNSSSNAIVPVVNQQPRQTDMQTAIEFGELLANIGGIVLASQACTIL